MKNTKSLFSKIYVMLFVLSLLLTVPMAVFAAVPYPSMPIRLIAPFAPGGGVDITARMIAPKLSERLGKQVIVENHPGGGSVVGTEMVAKAKPDGHTLVIVPPSHSTQPSLQELPYDPVKSFAPIALLAESPHILVVHPSVPAKSVKELLALAKQKPGQLIFGTSGYGAAPHLSCELLKIMADIDIKIVHFKGSGPALVDLIGGHSHASICGAAGAIPHIKSGKLRVLGTGFDGVKRSVSMPDVPTIAEAGVPGYQTVSWYALLGPAGMPETIIGRLSQEIKAILAEETVKEFFLKNGMEASYLGPSEFGRFLDEEIKKWAQVIKTANIKAE
jgi:tripartite-type tricarboxylate transporter receptor subunit TctC